MSLLLSLSRCYQPVKESNVQEMPEVIIAMAVHSEVGKCQEFNS